MSVHADRFPVYMDKQHLAGTGSVSSKQSMTMRPLIASAYGYPLRKMPSVSHIFSQKRALIYTCHITQEKSQPYW